jgi:hypothetical protein
MAALRVIDFSGQIAIVANNGPIRRRGIVALSSVLVYSPPLRTLLLNYQTIRPSGARGIAASLLCNTVLQSLEINHDVEFLEKGFAYVCDALPHNHTLTNLDLTKSYGKPSEAAEALLFGLSQNRTLQHVKVGLLKGLDQGLRLNLLQAISSLPSLCSCDGTLLPSFVVHRSTNDEVCVCVCRGERSGRRFLAQSRL